MALLKIINFGLYRRRPFISRGLFPASLAPFLPGLSASARAIKSLSQSILRSGCVVCPIVCGVVLLRVRAWVLCGQASLRGARDLLPRPSCAAYVTCCAIFKRNLGFSLPSSVCVPFWVDACKASTLVFPPLPSVALSSAVPGCVVCIRARLAKKSSARFAELCREEIGPDP